MSKQKNKKRSRDTETKPSGTTSPKFILTIGFSKLQTYIYIIQYCWEIIFYVFFWVKIYPFRALIVALFKRYREREIERETEFWLLSL